MVLQTILLFLDDRPAREELSLDTELQLVIRPHVTGSNGQLVQSKSRMKSSYNHDWP